MDQTKPGEAISFLELMHPSAKQLEFLEIVRTHKYNLYGGAKYGGKSYALRWIAVLLLTNWAAQGHENVRIMLACEDFPALKDRQITKIKSEFPQWLGTLSENQIEGLSFRLNDEYGGGIIALRNLDDVSKYASSEFAAILIDELTKNPKEMFDQFRSILRWPGISDPKFIGATNPGGIGNAWVKKLWIDRDFDPEEEEAHEFAFTQAFATDNPTVTDTYMAQLNSLPPALKEAYLKGSWETFEGQWADEWNKDIHVCDPFPIPAHWKKFRMGDHGRTKPTAWLWGALDEYGNLWVYREYHKAGVDADVNARAVTELSYDDTIEARYWFSVLDSACWSKHGGETIAEIYERNGVIAEPSSKDRHAGAALLHEYLRWKTPESIYRKENKLLQSDMLPRGCVLDKGFVVHSPKIRFFKTCVKTIGSLPTLIMDPNDPEVPDTDGDDHSYDALTYGLMHMHEGKTPKQKTWLEKLIAKNQRSHYVTPDRMGRFYSNQG